MKLNRGREKSRSINNLIMTVFILFHTDIHRTRASRVFFGVFTSEALAIDYAKENGLYIHDAEVVIIECETDKFGKV